MSPFRSLSPEELEDLQARLRDEVVERLESRLRKLEPANHVSHEIEPVRDDQISFEIADRLQRAPVISLTIRVEIDPKSRLLFRVQSDSHEDDLDVRLDDVHPELNEVLRLGPDGWAERQLARMPAKLDRQIQRASS